MERTNEVRTTTTTTASQRSPLSGLTAYSILSLSLLLLVLFGVRRRRRTAVWRQRSSLARDTRRDGRRRDDVTARQVGAAEYPLKPLLEVVINSDPDNTVINCY